MSLIFGSGGLKSGALVYGYEENWHWPRRQESDKRRHSLYDYNGGQKFFQVHWTIDNDAPTIVKLHVNAPKDEIAPKINLIKQEMVEALLSSDLPSIIRQSGYRCEKGPQIELKHRKGNKSTTVFRIVLTESQCQKTAEDTIKMVHAVAVEAVSNIVQLFEKRISSEISSP